jgi:hypothetical protein
MSYRVWWLLAFWALGVGVAMELEAPKRDHRDAPKAEARAVPAPVAAQATPSRGG